MRARSAVLGALAIGVISLAAWTTVFAEDNGGRRRFDPERFRQMMNQRMKETLQVNDEEWTVLQPMVEKVQTLSRDINGGGMRMMFGRRGGRMTNQQVQAEDENTPQAKLAKATQELQTALEDANAPTETVTAKLAALREAREAVQEELTAAQDALREVVTPKQEARLVLMGLLD